jgi:hypothetical protein
MERYYNGSFEIRAGGVGWMHLVQDRDQWRALVYTEISLLVSINGGNFLTS